MEAHIAAQLHQVRALDLRERVERRIWIALEHIAGDAGFDQRVVNALWDAFSAAKCCLVTIAPSRM